MSPGPDARRPYVENDDLLQYSLLDNGEIYSDVVKVVPKSTASSIPWSLSYVVISLSLYGTSMQIITFFHFKWHHRMALKTKPGTYQVKLFLVVLSKNHVFLAFEHLRGPCFQIYINSMVLLLITMLFFIRKWYYMLILNH